MRTIRYLIRLFLAYVTRFKILILAGIFIGVIIFLVLHFVFPVFFGKNVRRIGITGKYHVEELPKDILALVGAGLTKINIHGEIEEGLAKSWETKDGGKTWDFFLKENKFWQDKTRVTSKNINYEFEGVTIDRPNDYTISFKLQTRFSAFPSVVSHPVFKKGLLGTGSWKVEKLKLSGSFVEEVVLRNNDNSKRRFKFFPTEERTKLAFKLGEVDEVVDLIDPKPLNSWNTVEVTPTINKNRFLAIFFNTQDETLSDKSLRQALSYTIDKSKFESERAIGPISPLSWTFNPQVKAYDYDPEKAKSLFKGQPTIKLVTSPLLLDIAEIIAKDWDNVGIKTQVLVSSILPEEYQAFLAIYDIPPDPDQYSTWHSTQGASNISHYKNPRIDKLLEDGRIELDTEVRKKIYFDFQRFLLEDAPAAFLVNPVSYTVTRK
ncbi:hypothetical protein A3D00_03940 [Candidatus Woesebacteria bacterium RIFCSPHIGHO2_02_FULL_38_9]|uniref:Solute-binding protein family 5 domain-containing protein n=1 Tax=Candidatus Woesebacteria bacterium RIFCSPHIGHO2_01_FULL_39_28 TaxID=1802496 RepID=A0A1F7YJ80_9BACT|nr:MAG: hypothetical protein A2627_03255 [Candidatus Woesebacteria bacterium RIFCSPHIGHO2_01_FULL_39_28]OGM31817.1 MAG: hypothetical protein A3D00_03940 [Candidatus Woesebacteria bacterium RIFCSPHIGHO2_02_FULL_38_9]OGM56948.1 MAG: hypothetical protein A3A50_03600 [Candidatus Woesebacteria bacterium RIFCSPLOWO2_01_FULL_38_20]